MEFTKSELELTNLSTITVIHNLPLEGPNNIQDAFWVWSAKTSEFTAESFCNYINEKREAGLCNYYAFINEELYIEQMEQIDLDIEEENAGFISDDLRWIQLNHQVHQKEFELRGRKYEIEIFPFDIMPQDEKEKYDFPIKASAYLVQLKDGNTTEKIPVFMSEKYVWTTTKESIASNDKELFTILTNLIMDIYTE